MRSLKVVADRACDGGVYVGDAGDATGAGGADSVVRHLDHLPHLGGHLDLTLRLHEFWLLVC